MASAAIFSSLRRRIFLSVHAFLAPVELTNSALLKTLTGVTSEMTSSFSRLNLLFQRKNSRSLVRKIEVIHVLLENLSDLELNLPSPAVVCLREMYILLFRCKMLLEYCVRSSGLWLLIQYLSLSGQFHDLNLEMLTLLDVFPLREIELSDDVIEQVELLRKQCRRGKYFVDIEDEILRFELFSLLNEFEHGRVPSRVELFYFFVEKLRIMDAECFKSEIEFLEEQIVNHGLDIEPAASVLHGFIAMCRYCRFLLYGIENVELGLGNDKQEKRVIGQESEDTLILVPVDFTCPITLDLMMDPVIICTGQTYDRPSIARWMEDGNCTCPKTGQVLIHTHLVPNRALRNLIMHWCSAYGIAYNSPVDSSSKFSGASASKAAIESNKATAQLLIQELANGSQGAKTVAAREIRLLAKTGRENRAYIAEAGAIPHLKALLSSKNALAQENSVTAMLNLSIYDKNKRRIINEAGSLGSIVKVLRFGHTTEARENAAATLFSLSAVHEYKKRIAQEDGAVEALAWLLMEGTARGKRDAVTALFNLATHMDNCAKMIDSGAVAALVRALWCDTVAEEAAGALAILLRQPVGAEAVGNEETVMVGLIEMMHGGSPKGKENAVAALLELCRVGGEAATQRVLKVPAMIGLLHSLLFTGTKRARRKAASLARVFQRCENASLHLNGLGIGYAFTGNSAGNTNPSFVEDYAVPVSIFLPVV
ncbi:U-box domain-containing protein 17-like [Apium graveolens]|uniref:U-box domain-containing protein 17-like n=1 Tax=Apium graveolens TaxID=4045 RepID=UPI003D7BB260